MRRCEPLAELDRSLGATLKGDLRAADAAELLRLADFCIDHKRRYRDAVRLYAAAFGRHPDLADNVRSLARYRAAWSAVLASQETPAGETAAQDAAALRRRALDWLRAELATWTKLFDVSPANVVTSLENYWEKVLKDPGLTAVRDAKNLAKLPDEEQAAWRQLWTDADRLRSRAKSSYSRTQIKGRLRPGEQGQPHLLKLRAGNKYIVGIESTEFTPALRVEDGKGEVLGRSDPPRKGNPAGALVLTAPKDDTCRIVATSFQQGGAGAYIITVREFPAKGPAAEPPDGGAKQ